MGIRFYVPLINQERIVEVAYATTEIGIIKKVFNASDRSTSYFVHGWTARLEEWAETEGPGNTVPPISKKRPGWKQISPEEVDEFGDM